MAPDASEVHLGGDVWLRGGACLAWRCVWESGTRGVWLRGAAGAYRRVFGGAFGVEMRLGGSSRGLFGLEVRLGVFGWGAPWRGARGLGGASWKRVFGLIRGASRRVLEGCVWARGPNSSCQNSFLNLYLFCAKRPCQKCLALQRDKHFNLLINPMVPHPTKG